MALEAVCVFCGSQSGRNAAYVDSARATARQLARMGIEIVYGGGHVGLMGALADEGLASGARVVGIIPHHLMRPEVAHQGLSELVVVDSMHARKRAMADRSDAFVALPGGFGTLEELCEMVTWLQLGLEKKPVGLLNVNGFFDPLIAYIDHATEQGFIRAEHRRLVRVESSIEPLLECLEQALGERAG
ncbi:MAG: TIGR00730 family Rossman fold protein [Burkholderiaceae bacterium]